VKQHLEALPQPSASWAVSLPVLEAASAERDLRTPRCLGDCNPHLHHCVVEPGGNPWLFCAAAQVREIDATSGAQSS
jgi:hypothetical protein